MLLLQASSVLNDALYDIEIERGLAAEEIHFKVNVRSRFPDKEIDGLLAYLKAHKAAVAVIFSLGCEAVLAGKVTVVCDVKTESLYIVLALFELIDIRLINILGEQLARLGKLHDLLYGLIDLFLCGSHIACDIYGCLHGIDIRNTAFVDSLNGLYKVIDKIVDNVYGPAVDIKDYVVAFTFKLVDHKNSFMCRSTK